MKQKTIKSYFSQMASPNKPKPAAAKALTPNIDQNDSPNLVKCMTCYRDFDSKIGKKCTTDVANRMFDNYCRLLKVHLILPMQWNFLTDSLPFCHVCTATVTRLLELSDTLLSVQREMQNTLQQVKIEMLKSQDAHSKRMMEPLGRRRGTRGSASYIEKIDYFRSFAVKDLDPDVKLSKDLNKYNGEATTKLPNVTQSAKVPIRDLKVNITSCTPRETPEQMDVDIDMDDDNYEPLAAASDHSDEKEDENLSVSTVNIENPSKTDLASGLTFLKSSTPKMTEKEYIHKFATRTGKNEFSCNLCKAKFVANCRSTNFKRHFMTRHEKIFRYQCKYCSKQFAFLYEGITHIRTAHSNVPLNEKSQPAQPQSTRSSSRGVSNVSAVETPEESTRRNTTRSRSPLSIPLEEISTRVIVLNPSDSSEKYKPFYKREGEMFVCTICKHRLKVRKDIIRHIIYTHNEENFQCMYCSKKFFEKYVCVRHLKLSHADNLKQEFEALKKQKNVKNEVPDPSSNNTPPETASIIKIGKKYKCNLCSYTSNQRSNVVRHTRRKACIILKSKPKPHLKKKIENHVKPMAVAEEVNDEEMMDDPDEAALVANVFEQDGIIYRSMNLDGAAVSSCIDDRGRRVKKRYRCKKCKIYASSIRNNVTRHVMEVHFNITPFECSICHKAFSLLKRCRIHVANHTIVPKAQPNISLPTTSTTSKGVVEETPSAEIPQQSAVSTKGENNGQTSGGEVTNNGIEVLNTSRTRPMRHAARAVKSETVNPEELCIALPRTIELPLPLEILNKYVAEPSSSHCMVCDKQFAMIQPHIANTHEGVRNFKCMLCNEAFFYRAKCIYHIRDICLKKAEEERRTSNKQEQGSVLSPEKTPAVINLDDKTKTNDSDSIKSNTSILKPVVLAKKTIAKPKNVKTPVPPSGVYKDYYQRIGKMAFCKLCKRRITNPRNIAPHFVSKHADLCLYSCGFCDEKFNKKPLLNRHLFSNHASSMPVTKDESAGTENKDHVQTIKAEATWVESTTPVEESTTDSYLEASQQTPIRSPVNNAEDSPDEGPPSPIERPPEPDREPQPIISNNVTNHVSLVPAKEYGCISLPHTAEVNCDPFIDKDCANKCKVCNMSFKLRKLTIEHVKNVHLGVRRFQCEFCNKKYYNLIQCKQHVKSTHPATNTEKSYNEDRISVSASSEQENIDTEAQFSSNLQISNVHSQATGSDAIVAPEHVEISSSMLSVEEPVSFEPWKQLPSSQEETVPFFAVVSDESDEDQSDDDSQFVVFDQSVFGNVNNKDASPADSTDSLYDFVGAENIIELKLDKPNLPVTSFSEQGGTFICDICKRELSSRQAVMSHINIKHNQVEKFQCKLCDKKYYRKYSVAQHIAAVHMKQKIFKCTICQTSYSHSQSLRKHNIAVHGVTPVYKRSGAGDQWCEICSLPFQSAQDLMAHADRFHPVYKQLEL